MKRILVIAALAALAACGGPALKQAEGIIVDASMNTIVVETADATQLTLLLDDATDRTEAYGLLLGNCASVSYRESDGKTTAVKVACDKTYADAVGDWTQPNPIAEGEVQGIRLMTGGEAESIGMATLLYTGWEPSGEPGRIVLHGKSIGNGQTIDFTETATIGGEADLPTLTVGGVTVYTKSM